jgi:hypothetical protein
MGFWGSLNLDKGQCRLQAEGKSHGAGPQPVNMKVHRRCFSERLVKRFTKIASLFPIF